MRLSVNFMMSCRCVFQFQQNEILRKRLKQRMVCVKLTLSFQRSPIKTTKNRLSISKGFSAVKWLSHINRGFFQIFGEILSVQMKLQKKCRRAFDGNGLLCGGLFFQLALSLCFILDSAQFNYSAQLADHLTMLKGEHH